MKIKITSIIILIALFGYACKKQPAQLATENTAVINFITPVEHASYNKGDTIKILGTATNVISIHGYEITIHTTSDTAALYRANNHVHGLAITFQDQWINTMASPKDLQVDVKLFLDHDGNTFTRSKPIHCK